MALVHTPTPKIGVPCPDFSLPAVEGKKISLDDFAEAQALVVMFICNHCPYVVAIEDRLLELARDLQPKGAQFLGICSNDSGNYPEDAFPELKRRWTEKNYPFPYLHDESQEVAKKFGAVCTPDFFVYDDKRQLAYRGRLDDSWKDPNQVTQEDLRKAVEAILTNTQPSSDQKPSMGCSIKWL